MRVLFRMTVMLPLAALAAMAFISFLIALAVETLRDASIPSTSGLRMVRHADSGSLAPVE